jgi:hypothetical protein
MALLARVIIMALGTPIMVVAPSFSGPVSILPAGVTEPATNWNVVAPSFSGPVSIPFPGGLGLTGTSARFVTHGNE